MVPAVSEMPSQTRGSAPPPRPSEPAGRGRIVLARALTIVGILLVVVSLLANFVKREALDADEFRDTSRALIADEAIQERLASAMVEALYASVDVSAELETRLPDDLDALAGPIAGISRSLADRAALELLGRPRVEELYVSSTGAAHEQLIKVLEGETEAVDTTDGKVVIDIRPLVVELGTRFSFVENLSEQIPEDKARIVILDSDELGLAQDVTQLLKVVANWIWVLALLSWAGAVWLARGRRRLELRAVAIGLAVAGVAVVAVRAAAGGYLVDSLVASESAKPAAENAWSIVTDSLAGAGWTTLIVGLLALLGIWFAGPGRRAHGLREGLAPFMRRADISYGALVVAFLLFVWWTPVLGLRNIVVLGILAAIGVEALRRQTAREFPNAVAPDDVWTALRQRLR